MNIWLRFWIYFAVMTLALWLSQPVNAQIVTLPIPGAPGLSVTVGTGANALPLQDIKNHPNAVNITTWDDGWTNVPLPWAFPMFGQNFTNSWAATNGFVTFQDPLVSGLQGGCCAGVDLTKTKDPMYNYTIFGLHTDLYSWNTSNQYYLNQGNSLTYGWYNISQCCDANGGNSLEIKIDRFGVIDTRIAGAIVGWNPVTSGMSGDLSQGQYFQHYHGQGINIQSGSAGIFSWQALSGTTDMCVINPLSDPKCPGYASAYLTQQCTINPLYDPACPGYQQALLTQQCVINPLYSPVCPGYQQAYFTQQCSLNPLYDRMCPGYNTAYALQQQTQSQTMTAATTTSSTTVSITGTVSTTEPTVTISTSGTVTTAIALVPEAEVNTVITRQIPNASSPTGTVTVQVETRPSSPEETEEERRRRLRAATAAEIELALKEEKKREEEASERRKQLAERQRKAAQEAALEQGRKAIREADQAKTMDEQTVRQAYIVATMNFVPGFEAYGTVRLPDAPGYKPYEIYRGQQTVDNRRLQRGLSGAQEQRHADMVNGQYGR